MSVVYMAINILNGDRYIGVTKFTMKKRMGGHKTQALGEKRETKFSRAIRKYGWDNFTWVELAQYKTFDDALSGEIYFIDKLKPEYNLTAGGEGTSGHPSHNRKKVMCLNDGKIFDSGLAAAKFYGADFSEVAKVCRGVKHRIVGRRFVYFTNAMTEEKRTSIIRTLDQAQIDARRRKPIDSAPIVINDVKYASRSRPVICLDDGNTFPSISSAARFYKSDKSAIIEQCRGRKFRKTVNGRRFQYLLVEKEKV